MAKETVNVFQTDSELVNKYRRERANYVIEIDDNSLNDDLCVIYFSSHDIYYPNTPDNFNINIVQKDKFEWRRNTPISAYKQIFVRDLYKQWYIQGINNETATPFMLLRLLEKHTKGYRVITIGSSAGGYAAILYGTLLGAEKIIAFNPQFELNSLLNSSSEAIDPLIFRMQDTEYRKYYDLTSIIPEHPNDNIFYFLSERSDWDKSQYDHIRKAGIANKINIIKFNSAHHGIPFSRAAISKVVNRPDHVLKSFTQESHNSWLFSIRQVGLFPVITMTFRQLLKMLKKRLKSDVLLTLWVSVQK